MCLYYNKRSTQRFKRKHQGKSSITCYKVVCLSNYYNSRVHSINFSYEWKVGINKSNRETIELTEVELDCNEVDNGIHVYTNLDSANKAATYIYGWYCPIIMPVQCQLKHLVGCSTQSNKFSNEAVFTQVRVLKKDYLSV